MFYVLTVIIVGYMAYVTAREGSDAALRKSFIVVALLAPIWMTYNVRSIRLDFRIVQALAALLLITVVPPRKRIVFELCLMDVIVIGLVVCLCISQFLCGALAPLTPFDIAFTWLATYAIGRIYLQSPDDLRQIAPLAAKVIVLVGVLALIEAFTRVNPVNELLGKRFGILESGEGYRWGLKRVQGNVSHPIYNGFQLILFLPIVACLLHWGWRQPRKHWLAVLSPVALGLAIFFTISRGAQLGFAIACLVAAFLSIPRLRVLLVTGSLVAGLSLFAVRNTLVGTLGRMAGENADEIRTVMIDGEEVEYTGTKHRLLLLQVYRRPLGQAGVFGWGGSLKGVEIEPHLASRFGSIDSHYVLFFLQYGWFGMTMFVLAAICVICRSLREALTRSSWQPMAVGLAAGFISLSVSMTSVWFAPDYAAIWLFNAGLTCNIATLRRRGISSHEHSAPAVMSDVLHMPALPQRRLIPVTHSVRGAS